MFGAKRKKETNKSGTVMVLYVETLDRDVKKYKTIQGFTCKYYTFEFEIRS